MNRRGLTWTTGVARGICCLNSNILYENSTILDDRHPSPIRREPGYLAKPCKNTGFYAKPDMPGKLAASETRGVLVRTKWGFWFGHLPGIF